VQYSLWYVVPNTLPVGDLVTEELRSSVTITHCIGGWVSPRTGLDGFEKCGPQRDSIPGPSSP